MLNKILVTGVSSGIGYALSERVLNKNNHAVIGLARRADQVFQHYENYTGVTADFAKPAILESLFKILAKNNPDIKTIILSAGAGKFGEIEQLSFDDFQKLININFLSQALLVKHLMPVIKKNSGKILVIGSESALSGARKGSAYCASKFAMRGFVQCIRQELRQSGASVSLINPGLVNTDFFNDLDFSPHPDLGSSININEITHILNHLIEVPNTCVVEELQIQPLMSRVALKKNKN
jgi:short-subunit dehydrogenase